MAKRDQQSLHNAVTLWTSKLKNTSRQRPAKLAPFLRSMSILATSDAASDRVDALSGIRLASRANLPIFRVDIPTKSDDRL